MIFETQPLVSWPFFFVILSLLTVIGGTSLFFQWRKGAAPARLGLRFLFLFGFIACLSMAVLRPLRQVDTTGNQILVYEEGAEKPVIDFWKDSLGIKRAVSLSKFKTASGKVFLLGEWFTPQEIYPLRGYDFEWIQPEKQGAIRALSWKGYLRKGEVQRLSFEIFSESDEAQLEIAGANLEKQTLAKGWNAGLLEFYPSGLGKAEFPLVLDADSLATIRFFIGASLPKKYHFQLGFPSAESRTLSTWLQEKGETVTEEIKISRETVLQSGAADSLQILLIDPAQLDQKSIQDAMKTGKTALLVMNVGQAAETAQKLNRLFGTDFQVEQTGQSEDRILVNGVAAMPFVFQEKPGQKLLQDRSVAIQYAGSNPVAMSLVSASFPLARQGKTEIYESVWGELFGLLEPNEEQAWKMEAPLLSGISEEIQVFRADSLPDQLVWERDTLSLRKNAVNPHLATADLRVNESGWVNLDSAFSVAAYDREELPGLQTAALIREMKDDAAIKSDSESSSGSPISPWFWIIGMLLFLGLLWLEPKVDF
ncbi:hypothetical protein [Algoriphagus terrigena]|uniref:hypothetical protein n=1 Tax=Algoriphagus terrigena TaxID=344884 RepID=UPI0003FE1108|nr:hypothetical protein [Algoriphagus terrigena]